MSLFREYLTWTMDKEILSEKEKNRALAEELEKQQKADEEKKQVEE